MSYKNIKNFSTIDINNKLPNGWKFIKLKYLTFRRKEKSTSGAEELLSISEYKGVVKRSEIVSENEELSRSESLVGYNSVKKNDLVSNIMLTWKRGLGVSKYDGIVSPAYSVFSFREDCFPKYFDYLLRSNIYISEFRKNSTGVIMSRLRLYDDSFGSIFSYFPPFKEQKLISNYLDEKLFKIENLINITQKKINLLEDYGQNLLNKLVTKGNENNKLFKHSSIDWIESVPKDWKYKKLKYFANVYGRIGWKALTADEYVEQGYIFLSTPNIKNNDIDYKNVNFINKKRYEESPELKLIEGDVLFVKTGSTLGITNLIKEIPKESTVNSSITVIRIFDKIIYPEYLSYFLKANYIQNLIQKIKTGMGVPSITQDDIKNFKILVPPLKIQKEIIEIIKKNLNKIENLKNLNIKKIELLKEYRNSLIDNLTSGKLSLN